MWENVDVNDAKKKVSAEARLVFQANLQKEGLQLELDCETVFVWSSCALLSIELDGGTHLWH